MKNSIRVLCAILALLMSATLFVSCADSTDSTESNAATTTATASTSGSGENVTTEEVTTQKLDDYGRPYLEADIPADANYNGREFTIHMRGGVDKYEWTAENENGETLNDAIYKRNTRVEELLNVDLKIIAEGSWSNYNNELLPKVKASIQAGDGAYDMLAGYSAVTSLATAGLLYNLNSLQYIDFEKPWWSSAFNEETSIHNKNYFAVGAISLSMVYSMDCIFVNTDLLADCAGENYNIYQNVKDGNWTFEEVEKLSKQVWIDKNSNGIADAGDVVGLTYPDNGNASQGFFYSSGLKLISKDATDTPTLDSLDQEKTSEAIDAVIKLMFQTEGTPAGGTEKTILFYDGNSLFNFRWLYWGQTQYSGQMDHYGIVPVPKMTASQENYNTSVQAGMHMYCIPTDVKSIEENSIIMEALAAESYRSLMPAYFEVVMKSKYAKDAQTAQMLDLMYDTVSFDLAYLWRSDIIYWSQVSSIISNQTNTFASAFSGFKKSAKVNLNNLVAAIDKNEK